ncbi:MAG: PAS domain S-box protein [Dehalococcoidia bacterium]|nr:PAS domain S-box protein [Dehalococcoidia bacterium]
MTKKGKRTALQQRTEQVAELQKENEQLKARLAAPERTDEELRQSEERYRLLADNASDIIWVADMDLNMTYVSPSAARMLGCSMKELMTPAVKDLLLPESVRLQIEAFREKVASEPRPPSRSARELTVETKLQLRDGLTIWVEQRIDFIRDDANRLTGVMGITREITDRREAEEELRASEARNRLLIENANEGILVVQDEAVRFANPKLAEMSGYREEELISKPFLELFHPDDRQTILGHYVRRIKGEQFPHVYPIRLLDKAGNTKWAEINAVMLSWEGKPGVMALVTDLTERRAAQQALEESERKYRDLAEKSIQGLVVAQGLPPRFVYCNAAMARMTGYTVEELVSMSPEQFAALIHPEDLEMVFKRFTDPPTGAATEERLQFRGLSRDGGVVWLEMSATTVEYQGAPAVQAALIDITERKQAEETLRASEEKYRLLVDNANEAITVVQDGVLKLVNPKFVELTGYGTSELDSKPFIELVHPDDHEMLSGYYVKRQKGEEVPHIYQFRYISRTGDTRWAEINAVLFDWGGRLATLGLLNDITERKQAEETLRASEEKYRLLVDNATEAIAVIQDGGIRFGNPRFVEASGFSPGEFLQKPFLELVHPDDRQMMADYWVKALNGEEVPNRYQFRFLHKSGSVGWAEANVAFLPWEGRPSAVCLMDIITERRMAEEALRDSEAIYKRLFENTQTAMEVVSGETGLVVLANETTARMFGFDSAEDLVGVDSMEYLLPEEREIVAAKMAQAILNKDRSGATEMSVRTKDGRWLWINALVTYTEHKERTLLLISLIDLTTRKQAEDRLRASEEKYRLLMEQTNDIIWTTDMDLRTTYISPSVERILGFKPEERVGVEVAKAVTPESLAHVQQLLLEQLELERQHGADPKRTVRVEMEYYRKDGSTVWLENRVSGLRDEDGTLIGFHAIACDVSERRRAEQALRDSEAKYRNLFEHTLLGMEVVDGQTGKTVLANRSLARMFGFKSAADMVGTNPLDYVLPEDLEWVASQIAQLMNDPLWEKQVRIRARAEDGRIIWLTGMGTPFEYEGKPCMLISMVDITAAKEAELKLQESEEKNRLLVDSATEGIAVVQDGILKFTNRRFAESVGYSAQELVGRSFVDFICPDDRQKVAEYYFKRLSGEAAPSNYEFRWIDREGGGHWGEASIAVITWEGRSATLCMLNDITDRVRAQDQLKQSEERYRLLAENASDIIYVVDSGLRITYASPAVSMLLGYGVEEIIGNKFDHLLTPDSLAEMARVYKDDLAGEDNRPGSWGGRTVEIQVVAKDGSRLWLEAAISGVRDPDGRLAGFQGACRDITMRKIAEAELQKARDELEVRVEHRTAELKEANVLLSREIGQRQQAQEKLQESESKYRELVESANSIIMELDTKGKITFFNRFAQEFFGFSEPDILGRPMVGTIAPPIDSEGKDRKAQTRDLVKHPENYLVIENEGIRRNGERVWISWTNKGIYDPKGKLRNVLCIGMDRTEQRRVAEMLEQQLKEKAALEERQRLARDLHDAVTQTLFSASLIGEVLPRLWKRDRIEGERRLEELRRLTRGALAEMRMLLLELRPGALGEVGLANLLRQLVEATTVQTKLNVNLALRGECDAPAEVQVALYRVAQEALNNVVKHSGAEEAKIRLACEKGSVDLTVSDNGSGFDEKAVSSESLGLRIMHERAEAVGATLNVEGRAGRGAKVRAHWSGAKRKGDS